MSTSKPSATSAALPESVGILGLGLIGSAVASRLTPAGVRVRGFDPDAKSMAKLETLGGSPGTRDDVWQCDVVVSAVFNTEQLAAELANAPPGDGRALVTVSTNDPDAMPALAEGAFGKGYELVEAPISGTSADLANGEAMLIVAGQAETAERLAPLFEALARAHYHVGNIGNGNRAKLAINLILGLSRAAVAEGLVFAKAIGLEPADFLELALDSAATSKVMASKGPKMAARDFAALGRIAQSAKDFHLIRDAASRAGQGLPMVERYLEIIADNLANGEGDLDNSAVLLAIERTPAQQMIAGHRAGRSRRSSIKVLVGRVPPAVSWTGAPIQDRSNPCRHKATCRSLRLLRGRQSVHRRPCRACPT